MNEEFKSVFGDIHYMISQTPQVWLDFQVFEQDGGLLLIWDSIDDVFKPQVLDEMFTSFKQTVASVANSDDWSMPLHIPITEPLTIRKKMFSRK